MSTEYAKESKQNKQSAKQLKANTIEEQAETTEELIANLTEAHTRQVESLIKANTEAMKEMMSLFKDKTITPTNPTNSTNEEKKKRNTHPKQKMSVGNWTRIQHRVHHHGSHSKVIEGVWGPR